MINKTKQLTKTNKFKKKNNKTNKKRNNKTKQFRKRTTNQLKKYYGGKDDYKTIGKGHGRKVLIKIGEPRFVYKVFEPYHDTELSSKQCAIQQYIQTIEETSLYFLVKIPKLYSCKTDQATGITTLKFQRIYNITDTDINNPIQPTNILLLNDDNIDAYNDTKDKPLDYIKQYVDEDTYKRMIYELGQMFSVLNFKCQIRTDDVEIVFGKLKIDGPPKLFILDFDQCDIYNLESTLQLMETETKFSHQDFSILGRKHQMTLKKLDTEIKSIFAEGYLTYPNILDASTIKLANNILRNY